MRDLPQSNDPRLVVGTEGFSDAGVFAVSDDILMVQSLDFFAPLVDDPYQFGQIAAANSLSDVFAMGGAPATALNIVCFPDDQLGLDILSDILRGGADKVHEAGACCVGGHSVRDKEIKYGLSVTGIARRSQLLTNAGAKAGDVLVLTKQLGTGFITTAMKKGKCPDSVAQTALDGMACLNRAASEASQTCAATAVTDITGFGFAVHACEMAEASGVTLDVELAKLPILPGARELVEQGFATRANKTNREFAAGMVSVEETTGQPSDPTALELAYDPQTSGGLLITVPAENAEQLVDRVNEVAGNTAQIVGTVESRGEHALRLR